MDEFTFRLAYVGFGAALLGILLFLFTRGLNRKTYLRPILYGFFFAIACQLFFGGGIFAYLLGGALTGYLLSQAAKGWWWQFRAGGVNASVLMIALFVPGSYLIIGGGVYGIFTNSLSDILAAASSAAGQAIGAETLLYYLLTSIFITTFLVIAIVGVGAVLGGMLRKILKPAEQKPPSGSGKTTSSGVEQQ